jgi:predicted small lipoprotein YifL
MPRNAIVVLMLIMVNLGVAACGASGPGAPPAVADPASTASPTLKSRLEPGDIQSGMRVIKGRLAACYDEFKVPGMVTIRIVIDPSGRVADATVTNRFAGTPTGDCIAEVVRRATFGPFRGSALTITYPVVLR